MIAMNLRSSALLGFVLLLPLSIEVPTSSDSGRAGGETRITGIGAIGRYAIIDRGCEGQVIRTHPISFREAGGEIEHRFANDVTVGLRGGTVRETATSSQVVTDYTVYPYRDSVIRTESHWNNRYVNPSVSYEAPAFGIGAGWVLAEDRFRTGHEFSRIDPSFHLRIGARERVYFSAKYMESVPLYAGGGYIELGFGAHPHRLWDFHMGIGGAPFDGPGLAFSTDYRALPHWALVGRGRLGSSGGEPQSGIGLGLTYVSRRPVEVDRSPGRGERVTHGWGLGPRPRTEATPAPEPQREERLPEYGEYVYVDSVPVLVNRTEPTYPDSLRDAGVGGIVRLAILVGRDGQVLDARVMKSIPGLDEAALACVRQWSFRPAIRARKPLAYWLVAPVQVGAE